MSRKLLSGKRAIAFGITWIAAIAVAGCASAVAIRHPEPVPVPVHGLPAPSGMTRAEIKVRAEVMDCVNKTIPTGLPSTSGRKAMVKCITTLVPHSRRAALQSCLVRPVTHDNVWTAKGRQTFESKDAPGCVAAATK